jgi:DNA-binding transcriptional MerR regulator
MASEKLNKSVISSNFTSSFTIHNSPLKINMKSAVTKEAIKDAIDTLKQQGVYPSLEKIRNITGGSVKRISKLRKELENTETTSTESSETTTESSETSTSSGMSSGQFLMSQVEARMAQMELMLTQRFADIDARFAARERENKDTIIKDLQAKVQKLESKNALLIKRLSQELARVEELGQSLKQAKDQIAKLPADSVPKPIPDSLAIEPIETNAEIDDSGNGESEPVVIQSFNALINAGWDEKQNAEITLQKAVRQWLMEKCPADSSMLDNAVIESSFNDKGYIAVSISESKDATKPYIVHCLILERETKQLTWQRYRMSKFQKRLNTL